MFKHGRGRSICASLLILLPLVFGLATPLAAQDAATAAPPAKIQQLIELLDDPEVRQWLATRQEAPAPAAATRPGGFTSQWVAAIRKHLFSMRDAAPQVVREWRAAKDRVAVDMQGHGTMPILKGFAFVLIVAYGAEFLSRYLLRLKAGPQRLGRGLAVFIRVAPLVVFAIAAIAAFVLSGWPSQLEAAVAPLLIAWIVARLLIAISASAFKVAIAQGVATEPQQGSVALAPEAARFWYQRSVLFIGALAFLWAAADLMQALSVPENVSNFVTAALGLVVLGLAIETAIRRPAAAEVPAGRRLLSNALVVAFLVLLWLCWSGGMKVAFWLGVYALGLPPLLRFTTATTRSMRDADATGYMRVARNVLIDRGARFAIIALAAAWLAVVFQFKGSSMIQDDVFNRLFRGVLAGVVILLAADLVWQLTKEFINLQLTRASVDVADPVLLARKMRLRTLLPILRNFLAAFIAVVAGMMVLSALGVAIGPLIAGAGVFGVAIGFGSQTLVKDIISGIFYMMDDAFRVGEYIQSGSYMGTVESFSIRSVKLRHHRGPVFTVPFGSLGAVQNMSRDWVIDKFKINVAYDTDVANVKKVVKGVGAKLLEDPELGPLILETVKMKGVEQFGDYGITLSFAMKTKPGCQTQVRRRAQALIKEAFAANAIHFASPTVQVAGDDKQAIAAAAANRDAIARKNAALVQEGGEAAAE